MPMFSKMSNLGNLDDEDHPHTYPWYEAVMIAGTADEVRAVSDQFTDNVAGLPVRGVSDGQHDGQPARVFNLDHWGRIVVRNDAPIEWVRDFNTDDGYGHDRMEAALDAFWHPVPDIVSIECDVSWVDGENENKLIAEWSAEFGVSFGLVNPHGPGGGHPVYLVTGFRDRVEKWLRGPYECDDDDVAMYLAEVPSV